MSFAVRQGKLIRNNRPIDFIKSRYVGGKFAATPKILVVHFTYGASARSSAEWFRHPDNPGSSAHIVIDRDGTCYQCVDFETVAWHAGKSRLGTLVGLNNHALGIELANWGYLKRSADGWACHAGMRILDPLMAMHKNGNPDGITTPIGWEPYPEAQFLAALGAARALVDAYEIERIVGHDDVSPGRKWDPGPAFDMARFRARVFGERADNGDIRMQVAVDEGLNLRAGPGTNFTAIELLPMGALVEPIEQSGHWVSISVIGANGTPRATGWVHSHYLTEL